jgi:hypothetical protein
VALIEPPPTARGTSSAYVVIVDWLLGTGTHDVEVPFHFPPGAETMMIADGSCRVRVAGRELVLQSLLPPGLRASFAAGQTSPKKRGWHSPRFFCKVAAPVWVIEGTLSCPSVIVSVLCPGSEVEMVHLGERPTDTAVRLALRSREGWADELSIEEAPHAVAGSGVSRRIEYQRRMGESVITELAWRA